jgi:flagellar basal-body rod protein FlgC
MDAVLGAMDISASGLSAQRQRMNVIAENLANAETTRTPGGGPYRRKEILFSAQGPAPFGDLLGRLTSGGGVAVLGVQESQAPARRVYNPTHPDADAQGFVAMPNISPIVEMVDLLAATRAYEANVTAVQAAKSMAQKALEIGR